MRIVFLAPFGIRPKGTLIARMLPLAAALQERGHRVVIIAPPYTNPEDSGRTEEVLGVRLANVVLPRGGKAVTALCLAWRMYRAALAEGADLVHLFKPKGYAGLAAMLQLILRRVGGRRPPLIVDTDDWEGRGGMNRLHPYSALEQRIFAFQEQWLLRHATAVTVASRTLEALVWSQGRGGREVLYLPNGVSPTPAGRGAAARERAGIPDDVPVVLLYTRFFEFSQDRLYAVLAEIHRQCPRTAFLVVGAGKQGEERQLVAAAQRHGFAPTLHCAGWVDPGQVPDYLALADVAIYPFDDTLVNRTKCPAKLTELLGAGIAVVADRIGQIAEYIEHGSSGRLSDPDDWRSMADQVVELLRYPEERLRLAAGGRKRIGERFAWKEQARMLEEFYLMHQASPDEMVTR